MEDKNVEVSQVVKSIKSITVKEDISATHALGLQDLYNAAFSQEPDSNKNEHYKSEINEINIINKPNVKFLNGNEKVIENNETYKNSSFDDSYQLYSLKALEYSIDFVKPDEQSLGLNSLNFEDSKTEGKEVLVSSAINHPYESFQNVSNSVLDLDKGIQIHLVKTEDIQTESPTSSGNDISLLTYNYENCGYSGDVQILQKYLCDSANISNSGAENITLNFLNKQNNNIPDKDIFDNESVGVNPETLGVRFEDCDFNSSDSFASTESIIPKNINCPKCPKKFMFKSDLLRHDKYKHSAKPKLFCKYCNKEFVSQQNLLFHEKSHKKKRNSLKCEICKKVFKKSAVLLKHMQKKHSKNSLLFFCVDCNKNFSTQNLLNNHLKKFHTAESEKPYKCDICLKRFEKKQGLSCHAKAHTDEQLYICQHCNKSFTKICYLKNHLKSHQEDKDSFLCDICGKDYKSSSALEEHSRKHTGEKPFTCNVCMKSFAYKAYFKVHIKKHAATKSHVCNLCQKTFATPSDLNKHEKSHAKEKTYHCVNCNEDFSQQSHLISHNKNGQCSNSKSLEVFTQTTNLINATDLSNLTLQNVNVIVDQSFSNQHQILLTSIEGLINTNSVPVIMTQNLSET